jgi:hypothetical protein
MYGSSSRRSPDALAVRSASSAPRGFVPADSIELIDDGVQGIGLRRRDREQHPDVLLGRARSAEGREGRVSEQSETLAAGNAYGSCGLRAARPQWPAT